MLGEKYKTENNEKEKAKSNSEIDEQFDILYKRIQEMATNQSNFNMMMKRSIEEIGEPLERQIDNMRQESQILMKELERVQNINRDLLSTLGFLK
jgi:type I site-specific restriction endonuclease